MLFHTCATAFGYAGILFQAEPFLVNRVFLPRSRERALAGQIQATAPAKPGATPAVLAICKDLQAYFSGAPITPPWELLHLGGLTALQCFVLEAVAAIPYGEVRSYGQIAAQVGHPGAYRFVGTTLAKNPFPILIPCHRVIRADGSPGRFGGGRDLKKRMLELEAASAANP
ncbi:MAG: MGMT family protein [Thermodesulfobacteriota bacterium]|nr:MGMT family protein [Thermodesulfobacteriota bacterium]